MTVPRQVKKNWGAKLEKLDDALTKAKEDLLVGIFEARKAGLSQTDVAYHVEECSPSGVAAKEARGKAIFERRRGSEGGSGSQ